MGACDVLVCDGFSGNIVLKLTEGCAAFLIGKLKDVFNENPMTKLSALGVKNGLRRMKKDFDASEYGRCAASRTVKDGYQGARKLRRGGDKKRGASGCRLCREQCRLRDRKARRTGDNPA